MSQKIESRHLLDITRGVETPLLVLDLDRVGANSDLIRSAFGPLRPRLYYSVKANSEIRLLSFLYRRGWGFDVASIGEINLLRQIGVPGEDMTFSATIKKPADIREAYDWGVVRFGFDSPAELRKLAVLAPGCQAIVRLEVPQTGSRWPLNLKFGVSVAEAISLLKLAKDLGLEPYGVTFHVGSQCERTSTWLDALGLAREVWNGASHHGIHLKLLNLGGGFPASYTKSVPSVAEIGNEVSLRARQIFPHDTEYAVEPGRFIVADAGTIITTVIGKADRKGREWVYVDLSTYSGLLEVFAGWTYPIVTEKDDLPVRTVTLAGPSCDSTDVIGRDIELPPLEIGDRLMLLSAGAYTSAYQQYNGIPFPGSVILDSGRLVGENQLDLSPYFALG